MMEPTASGHGCTTVPSGARTSQVTRRHAPTNALALRDELAGETGAVIGLPPCGRAGGAPAEPSRASGATGGTGLEAEPPDPLTARETGRSYIPPDTPTPPLPPFGTDRPSRNRAGPPRRAGRDNPPGSPS